MYHFLSLTHPAVSWLSGCVGRKRRTTNAEKYASWSWSLVVQRSTTSCGDLTRGLEENVEKETASPAWVKKEGTAENRESTTR